QLHVLGIRQAKHPAVNDLAHVSGINQILGERILAYALMQILVVRRRLEQAVIQPENQRWKRPRALGQLCGLDYAAIVPDVGFSLHFAATQPRKSALSEFRTPDRI